MYLNKTILILGSLILLASSAVADRVLCSTDLAVEMPSYFARSSGTIEKSGGGIKFTPPAEPSKTTEVRLPLPDDRDFRLYGELEFKTSTENDKCAITVKLEARWPKHADISKKRLTLKKGTQTHKVYVHHAGFKTELRELVIVFHHEPEAKDEKNISVLKAPVEITGIKLNAVDYALQNLSKGVPERLAVALPPGLSPEAVKAGEAVRSKLQAESEDCFKVLKNRNSSPAANEKALGRLYDLQMHGGWMIQEAGLKVQAEKSTVYGWTGGADKILRDGEFPGFIGGTARVEAARNEKEGLQLALFAGMDLQNVSVQVGAFQTEDGTVFPAENITAAPIGYVTPTAPAYWSEYITHKMPDPLLSYLQAFDVEKEKFQPLWVDFSVPKGQKPGIYQGKVDFLVDGGPVVSVPVELTVRKFELPDRMTFQAVVSSGEFYHGLYEQSGSVRAEFDKFMFSEGDGDPSKLSPEAQRMVQINFDFFNMMREHNLEFHDIYRSVRRVVPGWRRRMINEYNKMFCLGYDNAGLGHFDKQFADMRQEGTAGRAYIYGYDEIRANDARAFAGMKKSYGELKKRFPEITTAATALDYSYGEKTGTTEELDIWIVPPGNFMGGKKAAERARARGKQVWFYPCNWPYPPDANLLLENRAAATRMVIGLMPWKFKPDGFLYYSTTMLGQQVQLKSLLKKWDRTGDVRDIFEGMLSYDGDYQLSSVSNKDAKLECWTNLPKDMVKPLTAEFEIMVVKGGSDARLTVELRQNHFDGVKTDNHYFNIDMNAGDWQTVRQEIPVTSPIRNMLFAVRLKGKDAQIRIRNINLYQEGVTYDRRITATKLLEGGPVLDENNYAYSMFRSNGDGTLIYPGPEGALPSIRLKFLRDGLEDYEYLVLLKKSIDEVEAGTRRVPNQTQWLEQARKLLEVDDNVCRSMNKYAKTGNILLDYRSKVANLLDQVQ